MVSALATFAWGTGDVRVMDTGRVDVAAAGPVEHDGVVVPGIPQGFDRLDEGFGTLISQRGVGIAVQTEIPCRVGGGVGGDDVPRGAATGQVVERRQRSRELPRVGISGRRRRDETDAFGSARDGRQRQQRVESSGRVEFDVDIELRYVGKEHRVERRRLCCPSQSQVEVGFEHALGRRLGGGARPPHDVLTRG